MEEGVLPSTGTEDEERDEVDLRPNSRVPTHSPSDPPGDPAPVLKVIPDVARFAEKEQVDGCAGRVEPDTAKGEDELPKEDKTCGKLRSKFTATRSSAKRVFIPGRLAPRIRQDLDKWVRDEGRVEPNGDCDRGREERPPMKP